MIYKPMVGDIGCVPMHAPGGPLIRSGELALRRIYRDRLPARAADYQHAFTYAGTGLVFEARPGGAGYKALVSYPADKILWLPRELSLQQRQICQQLIAASVGTPYSYLDYAAIAAHALDPDWMTLKDFVASDDHMICSQMCDWLHNKIGDHIFADGRWEGFVTPMDLAATAL